MNSLYYNLNVDVIKITLNSIDYYLSDDFYSNNSVATGITDIYPILISLPKATRSVGTDAGIRHDVSIKIFGKADFQEVGKGFLDLLKETNPIGAKVELRYYNVADGFSTTHSTNNIRQTLEVVSYNYDDASDQLSLTCRDTWFKDKNIEKELTLEDFPELTETYDGTIGGWVFGEDATGDGNVFCDAPLLETGAYFSGYTGGIDNAYNSYGNLWTANPEKTYNTKDWVRIHLNATYASTQYGSGLGGGAGDLSLKDNMAGRIISINNIENGAEILTAIGARLKKVGSPTDATGELVCNVYYVGAGSQPIGSPLATATIDVSTLSTSYAEYKFYFDSPLIMHYFGYCNYFVEIKWTNKDDSSNYVVLNSVTLASSTVYTKDRTASTQDGNGYATITNTDHQFGLYMMGLGTLGWVDNDTASIPYHSKLTTDAIFNTSDGIDAIVFKISIAGMEDDSSGTITGSANSLLVNAVHQIEFIITNATLGLGISSANIDSTSFAAAKSAQSYRPAATINQTMTAEELILALCRQCQLIFYTKRNGNLALEYQSYINATDDYILDEATKRGRIELLAYQNESSNNVVNKFKISYAPDEIESIADPAIIRRSGTQQYRSFYEYDSSDFDRLSTSQSLYGIREMREAFNFIYKQEDIESVINYYATRYSHPSKICTLQVLRKEYSAIDIFNTIEIQHFGLPFKNGVSDNISIHDDGQPIELIDNDGVSIYGWAGGGVRGKVTAIEETGAYMYITINTMEL